MDSCALDETDDFIDTIKAVAVEKVSDFAL